MRVLRAPHDTRAQACARLNRPSVEVLHDTHDLRLLLFKFAPGQELPLHRSPTRLELRVVAGRGKIFGSNGEERNVSAGAVVTYAPNEIHGVRAPDAPLTVLAAFARQTAGAMSG